MLVMGLALACAACSQEDAPVEQIGEAAEKVVAPAETPAPLAKGRFAPRDTCNEVEGAADFRRRLAAAVEARNADAFVALAAEDIQLDFGGGSGKAELRSRLADSEFGLWRELDEVLDLGCAANDQGGVTMPWLWAQDIGDADPYGSLLVLGEDVPVLAGPSRTAEKIGAISWDLVEAQSFDPDLPLQEVKLPSGRTGYIATAMLRSPIDYRLIASSRNGRWRITMFIAGD